MFSILIQKKEEDVAIHILKISLLQTRGLSQASLYLSSTEVNNLVRNIKGDKKLTLKSEEISP